MFEEKKKVKDVGIIRREILNASEINQQWEKDQVYVPEDMV
jgi:hypothetical protein